MPLKSDPSILSGLPGRALQLLASRPLMATLVATALISGFFIIFPGIDIAISASFFTPGKGFQASSEGLFRGLRSIGLLSINLSVVLVVCLTLARCLAPLRYLPVLLANVRPSALLFLTATLAAGPGLVANVILKDHWGRARPVDSILFGGSHAFTAPWIVSDACTRNCSFVSGEGSGVFCFVALVFVVPIGPRPAVAVCAMTWASLISLNRIAFGGHFLSDTLIGWGLMLMVMLILRDLLLIRYGAPIDAGIARWTGRQQAAKP